MQIIPSGVQAAMVVSKKITLIMGAVSTHRFAKKCLACAQGTHHEETCNWPLGVA